MFESVVLYCGLASVAAAIVLSLVPVRWRPLARSRALGLGSAGLLLTLGAALLPTSESRIDRPQSLLDVSMPVWQFNEVHSLDVAAPPDRVYDAIKSVRAG